MTEPLDELRRWDREIVWHAFTQMAEYEPLLIQRAHGCTLVDVDGREFLDGVSSLWCNVHGHGHPRLNQAIRGQLDDVAHVTSLGMGHPATARLAKRLVEKTPSGLEHVFFSSDGSSAVEVALKMALQYWRQCPAPQPEKSKYVALANAYHGDTLGSVSVGGVERFHEMFRPLLFDVIRLPSPDCYRRPNGVALGDACAYYLDQLEQVLKVRHREIAALVTEPLIQGAAGMITHPSGYLRGVRDLTQRYDILLIADEVAVGFGRTGRMFACEHEDVSPDLMCLGKGLTGGYLPMAATMATDKIWEAFLGDYSESRTFFHGHTFGGNPLAAATALASLDVFEAEQTLAGLKVKIDRLRENLAPIADHPHVGNVRQVGLIAAIELVQDRATKQPFPWTEKRGMRVCDYALTRGVWIRPLGNVIVIMPPLSITLDELDRICDAARQGIVEAIASQ